MDLYKLTVDVAGRSVEVSLRQGILATAEFGSHKDRVEKAESKVSVLVGTGKSGLAAWVQVSDFESDGTLRVVHEGWIKEGDSQLPSTKSEMYARASLSRIQNPSPEVCKCQEEADFGPLACCTAYGSGCYVRCCGGCCADPTRCPGATCCP